MIDSGQSFTMVFGDDFFAVHFVNGKAWFLIGDANRQDSHMRRGVKFRNASYLFSLVTHGDAASHVQWCRAHWERTHDEVVIRDRDLTVRSANGMASGDPITGANATLTGAVCAPEITKHALAGETEVIVAGFPYELGATTHLERCDFLSMLWYPAMTAGRQTVKPGPKLGRILAKTFWHVGLLGPKKQREHLRGIVECLWLSCSHIPVLNDLLLSLLDKTQGVKPVLNDPDEMYKIRGTEAFDEHPAAEEFMAARYSIGVAQLSELRAEARAATPDTVFRGDVWNMIVLRDC